MTFHDRLALWLQNRRDMPAGLSYEDFVAAALDTQRQLSAQSLAEVFSALDQVRLSCFTAALAGAAGPAVLSCFASWQAPVSLWCQHETR